MAAPDLHGWENLILKGVGAPATAENLRFVHAWTQAEGGTAANNPFNTTQTAPGATAYNSVGVRNYGSPQQGVQATVDTLNNGRYGDIITALRQGSDANAAASALVASPWGTTSLVQRVLGSTPAPPPSALAPLSQHYTPPVPVTTQQAAAVTVPQAAPQSSSLAPLLALMSQNQQNVGLPGLSPALLALASQTNTPPAAAATPAAAPAAQPQAPLAPLKHAVNKIAVQGKVTERVKGAVNLVQEYLGTPYVWGGENPGGFDCSGLLQYVWGKVGVQIPRVTYDQFKAGTPVGKSQLRPGDAVFFTGSDPKDGLPGHVGMYLGGNKFVEAPHTGATVRISDLSSRSDFVGGRRYA